MARCIIKLLDPTDGKIVFKGRDISKLSRSEMRPLRREMMMVFQDPYASLNARKRVGFIVAEALDVHGIGTPPERKRRVRELLEVVGLNPEHYNRFPHEFSGGQRQRIGIARALAINPRLIVCDEPVSALDVSVQAQILNLLKDLQKEFGLTYVFIAHDLNVVRHISDRVMVMYLGKAVEVAGPDELYAAPKHPYTGALLSAVPIPDPELGRQRQHLVLEGDVPNPINPPSACNFHPRCPRFHQGHCDVEDPELRSVGGNGQAAACHYPLEKWPMTAAEMRSGASGTPQSEHLEPSSPRPLFAGLRRLLVLFVASALGIGALAAGIGLALRRGRDALDLPRLLRRRSVPPRARLLRRHARAAATACRRGGRRRDGHVRRGCLDARCATGDEGGAPGLGGDRRDLHRPRDLAHRARDRRRRLRRPACDRATWLQPLPARRFCRGEARPEARR